MKKQKKWQYIHVIQQHFGYGDGWEDVSEYEIDATKPEIYEQVKHDLAEYRMMGYSTRLITRKIRP